MNDSGESQPDENALDIRHIGRLAKARRSAYRSRSYCLIGAGGCFVGAGELVYLIFGAGVIRGVGYAAGAIGLVWMGWRLVKLSFMYLNEARKSGQADPDRPPDFSRLSDGSQIARKLEEMTNDE